MATIIDIEKSLLISKLDTLLEFFAFNEQHIQEGKIKGLDEIEKYLDSKNLFGEERYVEWELLRQEHEVTFKMFYVNFSRYSFIVLVCLVVEDILSTFYEEVKEKEIKQQLSSHEMEGDDSKKYSQGKKGLSFYSNYFENKLLHKSPYWIELKNLIAIRNRIVHSSGKVTSDQLRKELNSIEGVNISNYETYTKDVVPLFYDTERLLIGENYIRQLIPKLKDLLLGIYDFYDLKGLVLMLNQPNEDAIK